MTYEEWCAQIPVRPLPADIAERLLRRRVVERQETPGGTVFERFDNGDTRTTTHEYRVELERLTREYTGPVATTFYDYVMRLPDPGAKVVIENIPDEPDESIHF